MKFIRLLTLGIFVFTDVCAAPGDGAAEEGAAPTVAAPRIDFDIVPESFLSGETVTAREVRALLTTARERATIAPDESAPTVKVQAGRWMRNYSRSNDEGKERMRLQLAEGVTTLYKAAEAEDVLPCKIKRRERPAAGSRRAKAMRQRAHSIGCVAELEGDPTQAHFVEALRARGIAAKPAKANARWLFGNLRRCRTARQREAVIESIKATVRLAAAAAEGEELLIPGLAPKARKVERAAAGRSRDGRDGAACVGAGAKGRHRGKARKR